MSDYKFADWIPDPIRHQLLEFWGCFGRTMRQWEEYVEESVPGGLGSVGMVRGIDSLSGDDVVHGRFIPMWNNMARVVLDDGSVVAGSFEQTSGSTCISYAEWLERGENLFGSCRDTWRFVCPACGNKQSIESVVNDNSTLERDHVSNWIYYNCQGRYTRAGCDWTLGGFLRLHRLEVLLEDGSVMPVFDYDGA